MAGNFSSYQKKYKTGAYKDKSSSSKDSSSTFGLDKPEGNILTRAATGTGTDAENNSTARQGFSSSSSSNTKKRSTLKKIGDFLGIGTGDSMVDPISGKAFTDQQGNVAKVKQGTLPISPVGPVSAIGGATKYIKPTFGSVIGKAGTVSKTNLAKAFPGASETALKSVVRKFDNMEVADIMKVLQKKPVNTVKTIGKAVKIAGTVGAGLLSTDTLTTWFALDNVLSGTKFMIPDIQDGIANGSLSQQEAMDMINSADDAIALARNKVDITSRYNPLMYPARKLILAGADVKEDAWNVAKENYLYEVANPQEAEAEWTPDPDYYKKQEAAANGEEYVPEAEDSTRQAVEDAGMTYQGDLSQKYSGYDDEDEEDSSVTMTPELTALVAKRDGGYRLTPEEEAQLIAAGLPDRRQQGTDSSYGSSALGFGLV